MALSITDNAKKLWDAWNIRGFIILSVFLQAYLILFATLRKGRFARKFYFRWPTWLAYLSADWVATYTIGLIFSSGSNRTCTSTSPSPPKDVLVFWASFLLLHLGGPDNITSYALEDNEFWKRHLFGLLLQVGFTIYAFLKSFSKNKLWLPTILVLFAGIMKYAERSVAFYRASFDHFGKDWVSTHVKRGADKEKGKMGTGLPIPVQFRDMEDHTSLLGAAVQLFGNIKRALVGPLLKEVEQRGIREKFLKIKGSQEVRKVLKIELSLLYELLHTKLPVIDSNSGRNFRMTHFGCISLALVLFSLAKRHYQLVEFDMLLTYGLLIGGLALDFLSITLLFRQSYWLAISRFQKSNEEKVIARQNKWFNEVSQLNFITYQVKDMPVWLNKLADILHLKSLLKVINGIRCQSSHFLDEKDDQLWRFVYYDLKHFPAETKIKEVWLGRGNKLLLDEKRPEIFDRLDYTKSRLVDPIFDDLDYTQSLLVHHIATEICYQMDDRYQPKSGGANYRQISKVLSDYMFYVAVMQPTMMAEVLDNWNTVFRNTLEMIRPVVPWSFFSNEKTACRKILDMKQGKGKDDDGTLFSVVHQLACLFNQQDNHNRWKLMSRTWVELMCYAAINCKPNVHAQQPSRGGELLTLVWLLMNHLGLGTKYYATLRDKIEEHERGESESDDDSEA